MWGQLQMAATAQMPPTQTERHIVVNIFKPLIIVDDTKTIYRGALASFSHDKKRALMLSLLVLVLLLALVQEGATVHATAGDLDSLLDDGASGLDLLLELVQFLELGLRVILHALAKLRQHIGQFLGGRHFLAHAGLQSEDVLLKLGRLVLELCNGVLALDLLLLSLGQLGLVGVLEIGDLVLEFVLGLLELARLGLDSLLNRGSAAASLLSEL